MSELGWFWSLSFGCWCSISIPFWIENISHDSILSPRNRFWHRDWWDFLCSSSLCWFTVVFFVLCRKITSHLIWMFFFSSRLSCGESFPQRKWGFGVMCWLSSISLELHGLLYNQYSVQFNVFYYFFCCTVQIYCTFSNIKLNNTGLVGNTLGWFKLMSQLYDNGCPNEPQPRGSKYFQISTNRGLGHLLNWQKLSPG